MAAASLSVDGGADMAGMMTRSRRSRDPQRPPRLQSPPAAAASASQDGWLGGSSGDGGGGIGGGGGGGFAYAARQASGDAWHG